MANEEPTEFYAGDLVTWQKEWADYPADTYAAQYVFQGPKRWELAGVANGVAFDFEIDLAESAVIAPGRYSWTCLISLGGGSPLRITLETGRLLVRPNPEYAATQDTREHCEIMLEAIERVLQGKAGDDVVQKSIGGIQIIKMRPRELEHWRAVYSSEVRALRRKEKRDHGLSATQLIRPQNLGRRA